MKLKTTKAASKRFKVTGGKNKKVLQRYASQDHFNARESGKVTRNKRRDCTAFAGNTKSIKKLLPYV